MKRTGAQVQPRSILRAMLREMEREKKVLVFTTYAPHRYEAHLNPDAWSALRPLAPIMRQQVAEALSKTIERKKYRLLTPAVTIELLQVESDALPLVVRALFSPASREDAPTVIAGENNVSPAAPPAETRPSEEPDPAVPCLLEWLPTGTGRMIPLGPETVVLGREEADICAPADNACVSRRHANIRLREDGARLIEDLGSSHGVLVNGRPIAETAIKHGDIIDLGGWRLECLLGAGDDRAGGGDP